MSKKYTWGYAYGKQAVGATGVVAEEKLKEQFEAFMKDKDREERAAKALAEIDDQYVCDCPECSGQET